eukprot:scaffold1697_cov120-Cylindrotheca_fusiformis.AAC.21
MDTNVLGGVSSFEKWFQSVAGADCSGGLSHDDFGNLRGLTYKTSTEESVMTIPKSIVLDSNFDDQDWDAQLAEKLWKECKKGPSSSISGYVQLLTRGQWDPAGQPALPPSTAPDALRHWTDSQLSVLKEDPSGKKVLDLMEQQQQIWRRKFSAVSEMTWEEFQWAMEVVHSRSFCGNFGVNNGLPKPLLLSLPLLAGMMGYYYYAVIHGQNDLVLAGLALVAGAPALFSLLSKDNPVAVLLPLIDSANHMESADSVIQYDPLSESFTLTVGEGCIVNTNGKDQLFISYGEKKDTELLLNYGFLQGVDLSGDFSDDSRRKKLADAFLARQL